MNSATYNIRLKIKLAIATYNMRSMNKDEKLYELEEALKLINWDILEISEVRKREEQCITLNSGNTLFHKVVLE
ncbi:hypothetical protein RN001_013773 [Aquatica leii]|uniref:Uncharacterized protein n=1 Tax=Aquatica leii TaxID=1421715 RepID=A0AAN7QDF9_9COLE|nr:hypothetical protein RN001_013773 [Aquatica leii]